MTPEQRLLRYVVKSEKGCWDLLGSPRITVEGHRVSSRRVAYELWVGPLSASEEPWSTCLNRHCIRPEHLELLDLSEYRRRVRYVKRHEGLRGELDGV